MWKQYTEPTRAKSRLQSHCAIAQRTWKARQSPGQSGIHKMCKRKKRTQFSSIQLGTTSVHSPTTFPSFPFVELSGSARRSGSNGDQTLPAVRLSRPKFNIVSRRLSAMILVPYRRRFPALGNERPCISCSCELEAAITTSNHNPVFRGMLWKFPGF